jgi:hypothetical protein
MLLGAKQTIADDKIGYFFISTHSDEVHYKCLELLKQKGYLIVTSIDLQETFSEDGLIVAKNKIYSLHKDVGVSKKVKIKTDD